MAGLSGGCTECLTRDPLRSLESVAAECAPLRAPAPARAHEPAYVYGGSYGIGILTSAEVLEHDFLRFESEQIARGALYARVRSADSIGELQVFCTHLTANTHALVHPARRGSWRAEHARQVSELAAWIASKAGASAPVLLLGDLNTGPALPDAGIGGRATEQYAVFLRAGFINPYIAAGAAECSFCSANTLNGAAGRGGSLIDHVLLRGALRVLTVERVLDEKIDLVVDGRRIQSHLSDHHGLAVVLSRAQTAAQRPPDTPRSL